MPEFEDANLLVGLNIPDDAAVYKISDELALIQTVDFFTPVVDDPYLFGQISAANALSDIYAMGGRPVLALNIVCFPDCLSQEVLVQILKGGADKVQEAGAVIAGGHSVSDDEPKYGLCVSGLAHPDQIIASSGAKPGDLLVLTKPIGTGIASTAVKADMFPGEAYSRFVDCMASLNRDSSEAMREVGAHACTDITGFGLLGHAVEMAQASGVSLVFYQSKINMLPFTPQLAAQGLIPAGAYNNRDFFTDKIRFASDLTKAERIILLDPQTSGGLLIALEPEKAEKLVKLLHIRGVEEASIVGKAVVLKEDLIEVQR